MYSEAYEQCIDADYSPTPPKPIPVEISGETLKRCPQHGQNRYRVYFDRGPFTEAECTGYQKRRHTPSRNPFVRALLFIPQKAFPKWTLPDPTDASWFKVKVHIYCPLCYKEKQRIAVIRFAKPYCRLKHLGYMVKRTRWFRPVLKCFRHLRRSWFELGLYVRSRSVFAKIFGFALRVNPDWTKFTP